MESTRGGWKKSVANPKKLAANSAKKNFKISNMGECALKSHIKSKRHSELQDNSKSQMSISRIVTVVATTNTSLTPTSASETVTSKPPTNAESETVSKPPNNAASETVNKPPHSAANQAAATLPVAEFESDQTGLLRSRIIRLLVLHKQL
ncbi:hypothetical protein ElyMa_000005700 [Elysia marginata]|uniref:Uncharacterized protein n=1 Tax=Elysia marginata TaxID=1093978 RepID=A0AAV4EAR6_9GAST|nr:hypothetical protein ElyMa_000005700 [Elysia marginata]